MQFESEMLCEREPDMSVLEMRMACPGSKQGLCYKVVLHIPAVLATVFVCIVEGGGMGSKAPPTPGGVEEGLQ